MEVAGLVLAVSSAFAAVGSAALTLIGIGSDSGSGCLSVVAEDDNPTIDIVAVHGLGAGAHDTWICQDGAKKVNWISDLLPTDIEHTRILAYSYSGRLFATRNPAPIGLRKGKEIAKKQGKKNVEDSDDKARISPQYDEVLRYTPQALYLQSNRLVEELTRLRGDSAHDRPIIFIAHGLGGLIVKDALVHASAAIGTRKHQKTLQLCTIGVFFFGVPQQETREFSWSRLLNRMLSLSHDTAPLAQLQSLSPQSELFDLQVQRYKSIEFSFENYSFWEQKRTGRGTSGLFVAPKASILPIGNHRSPPWWHNIPLPKTYQNMVKFSSSADRSYQKVLECMRKCLKDSEKASGRCAEFYRKLEPSDGDESITTQQNEAPVVQVDDPEVIRTIHQANSLSKELPLEKRRQEAETPLKKELARCEMKTDGLFSGDTLELLKQLAQYYTNVGEFSKAELLYKRLFVATQDRLGPWSLAVAAILQSIAEVVAHLGQYVEAIEFLFRVEAIQNASGEDTAAQSTRARIAILYDKQGNWQAAEKLYRRVIKDREADPMLGDLHEDTLKVMENLALNYRMRGKMMLTHAKRQYELVLVRREEILKRNDGKLAISGLMATGERLAEVYIAIGDKKAHRNLRKKLAELRE